MLSADLRSIIDDVCAPYRQDSGHISLGDEAVKLAPRAALMLAMVLHEFFAHAAKYGALSVPGGTVDISWKVVVNGGPHLRLDRHEAGGPAVQRSERRGFPSRLLERGIIHLNGSVQVAFPPEGVRCALHIPLADSAA